jgi:hypothetical protein
MSSDQNELSRTDGSVDSEPDVSHTRSVKEKFLYALVMLIAFVSVYLGITSNPEVDPRLRSYSAGGYTTFIFTQQGAILAGIATSVVTLILTVVVVDQIKFRLRTSKTVGASLKPEETLAFGDWYKRVFGGSSPVAQGLLWLFYGFLWIPIWYFVSSGGAFGHWYKQRLGKTPFVIQIILWMLYGFFWIPLWYLVQRYTKDTPA